MARMGNLDGLLRSEAAQKARPAALRCALFSAARRGSTDILELILGLDEDDCDVSCCEASGTTILHAAAAADQVDTVLWLRERASVHAKDEKGRTPLDVAGPAVVRALQLRGDFGEAARAWALRFASGGEAVNVPKMRWGSAVHVVSSVQHLRAQPRTRGRAGAGSCGHASKSSGCAPLSRPTTATPRQRCALPSRA